MNRSFFLPGIVAALVLGFGCLAANPSAVMVPQPQVSFSQGTSGTWKADWEGVTGRTYLMQWSADLVNWNYFPVTEAGAGTKAYGFAPSPEKFFLRLNYSDETPDLAKTADWEPPLLLVGGEWTVLTKQKNGDPATGVELSFHRWPATSGAPQSTSFFKGSTTADGSYLFNPVDLAPGDRVEVRMTGSPGQRVYLPWSSGRETADANIAPGGNGLTLTGILWGDGTGQVPDYTAYPGGFSEPPPPDSQPVYRFEDFLTVRIDFKEASFPREDNTYPTGQHQITRDLHDIGGLLTSTTIDTRDDWGFWNEGRTYEEYGYVSDEGAIIRDSTTNRDTLLSVDFGDPTLALDVRRNLFVKWPLALSEEPSVASYAPSVIPSQDIEFKDQIEWDVGTSGLPIQTEGGADSFYSRRFILGPVPMYVPKSVLGGKPFLFENLNKVELYGELPFGSSQFVSHFGSPFGEMRAAGSKVRWRAAINGSSHCRVVLTSGENVSETGEIESQSPMVKMSFINTGPFEFDEDFSVTVTAQALVATSEWGIPGGYLYTYDYTPYDLGSFTTDFEFSEAAGGDYTPPKIAKRQAAELRGVTGDAPESDGFNGGQRFKTLEPERRIGIDGKPAPSAPTFVDALTGRFHHSETDFSLAIPGSDLSLSVTRSARDTIWTHAFGLSPDEDPQLLFGPGWESNLAGSAIRIRDLLPDGNDLTPEEGKPRLNSRISVRDYQGRAFDVLEFTDVEGGNSFLADPTILPERGTAGISLSRPMPGTLVLTQPVTGLVHAYQKSTVDFRIPNNRDTPTVGSANDSGFTGYEYFRLTGVTDRFGVTLSYTYGANPANLAPDSISVAGRPDLTLRFQQSDGRIQAFWDPSGIKHTYAYDSRDLAASGETSAVHDVLASHRIGSLTTASYGYQYLVEEDPRPVSMLAVTTTGSSYAIPTYHIAPMSIANGMGDTITVYQRLSNTRFAMSAGGDSYFHPSGDPLVVDSITLPNQRSVGFDLQHVLKNRKPEIPADGSTPAVPAVPEEHSIVTVVTTMRGDHWRYEFGTPLCYRWQAPEEAGLPTASALVFPTLTRSCMEVADSAVVFEYDASAGFALRRTADAAARTSTATYTRGVSGSQQPLSAAQGVGPQPEFIRVSTCPPPPLTISTTPPPMTMS
jgi:hypothetical protein